MSELPSNWKEEEGKIRVKGGNSDVVKRVWFDEVNHNIVVVYKFKRTTAGKYWVEFFDNPEVFKPWRIS